MSASKRPVQNTAIHLGNFHFMTNSGEDRELDGSMSMVMRRELDPDVKMVYQKEVTVDVVEQNLTINKKLGNGSFGTAYLAHWKSDNRKLVAKFSNRLLDAKVIAIDKQGHITYQRKSWSRSISEGINDMKQEYQNAVRILAPYYYNELAEGNHDSNFKLSEVSREHFSAIQEEARRLRVHPGYAHLHKIVHFISELACIFSEFCDGSLHDLIQDRKLQIRDLASLQSDVTNAVDYLLNIAKVAHMDIKPENVLYQMNDRSPSPSSRIVWKLADFGLCQSLQPSAQNKPRYTMGSPLFMPRQITSLTRAGIFASDLCMIYAYAVTLLVAISSLWPQEHRFILQSMRAKQIISNIHARMGAVWYTIHYIQARIPQLYPILYILDTEIDYLNPDPNQKQAVLYFLSNIVAVSALDTREAAGGYQP